MNAPTLIDAKQDVTNPLLMSATFTLLQKAQHEIQPDLDLLDAAEHARYQRLLDPQKQLELLTGRTLLKHVLADYLAVSPLSVSLSLTATGKPYIATTPGRNAPFFNLSHAQGYYLIGLSGYPIGVDVEPYRPVELSHFRHFLNTNEWQQLLDRPELERARLFFRLFTAKEAFLKATDKRWPLHAIAFQLVNDQWLLTAPHDPFLFTQIDHEGCCITVCVEIPVQ